jgi:hypothetical protein
MLSIDDGNPGWRSRGMNIGVASALHVVQVAAAWPWPWQPVPAIVDFISDAG